MGIVLLSINGVGLGHLARMTQIADQLYSSGSKPVLFYQNKQFPFKNKLFHKVKIRNLFRADAAYLRGMESKVNAACNIAAPRIFIEDTHPVEINLRQNIARFLLVRPTTFEYLKKIVGLYWDRYDAFFIADHIDSPTWPYGEAETAEIASWQKCHQVGPVFRRSLPEEIETVKAKYGWEQDVPMYVFSMGGGGQQAGANDVELFLKESRFIIERLRNETAHARFLFVKGPLFPAGIELPDEMEVVNVEENMPALFSIAQAAIIRPGFNSIWECIQAQTPFYYIEGTTFSEPIDERMARLAAMGLVSNKNALRQSYREHYQASCRKVISKWNGQPSELFFSVIEKEHAMKSGAIRPANHNNPEVNHSLRQLAGLCASKKIFIRVDDVVSMTDELHFILSLAKELGIFCSLEVIPYLSTLEEEELLPYDPALSNIIISQHGYGHVLNTENPPGIKCEFTFSNEPAEEEIENLLAGKKYLEQQFPQRFTGGFSAPFDCFPPWLPPMLQAHAWQYLLVNQPGLHTSMKTLQTNIDVWDWHQYEMKPLNVLLASCITACLQNGYCALTLHPILLEHPAQKNFLRILLTELKELGFESYAQSSFLLER